jgi:hypothetical protein
VPRAVADATPGFAKAAAADGIDFTYESFDWLCEQGHVGFLAVAQARRDPSLREPVTAAVAVLEQIYADMRGDSRVIVNLQDTRYLLVDLYHGPTGTLIELDESPHFTSYRLAALERYPADAAVGFDLDEYRALCREWAPTSDKLRGPFAKGFTGAAGLQRERAYRDSLYDLATPAMHHPPLVRVVALDGDGEAAYARNRERLVALLDGAARR